LRRRLAGGLLIILKKVEWWVDHWDAKKVKWKADDLAVM
jgi:hypothetical protein